MIVLSLYFISFGRQKFILSFDRQKFKVNGWSPNLRWRKPPDLETLIKELIFTLSQKDE